MRNKLLLIVGLLLTLSTPASASSLYYSQFNSYSRTFDKTFQDLAAPEFDNSKAELQVKVKIKNQDAFIGEYNEGYYTNPTVTPYYYPDNNQKSHQKLNPFNYIY